MATVNKYILDDKTRERLIEKGLLPKSYSKNDNRLLLDDSEVIDLTDIRGEKRKSKSKPQFPHWTHATSVDSSVDMSFYDYRPTYGTANATRTERLTAQQIERIRQEIQDEIYARSLMSTNR